MGEMTWWAPILEDMPNLPRWTGEEEGLSPMRNLGEFSMTRGVESARHHLDSSI
jgi:hypothetical protein